MLIYQCNEKFKMATKMAAETTENYVSCKP